MSLNERIHLLHQSSLDNNKENIEDYTLNGTNGIYEGSPDQSIRRNMTIRQLKDQFEHKDSELKSSVTRSIVRRYLIEEKLVKKQIELNAEKVKEVAIPLKRRSVRRSQSPMVPPEGVTPSHLRFFGLNNSVQDKKSATTVTKFSCIEKISGEIQQGSVDQLFEKIFLGLSRDEVSNVEQKFGKLFQSISQRPLGMTFLFSSPSSSKFLSWSFALYSVDALTGTPKCSFPSFPCRS